MEDIKKLKTFLKAPALREQYWRFPFLFITAP
jgi:hypothetical protein